MNHRQELFCLEYAKCGNATKAAIAAGYSQRTAGSIGQRLLKNVDIQNHLQEIQEEINEEKIASISEIQAFWSEMMRDESERANDRLKASELLAKCKGTFNTEPGAETSDEGETDNVILYVPDNGLGQVEPIGNHETSNEREVKQNAKDN